MRNIDENVLQAQQDKQYLEEFIKEYEVFILHTAHKGAGQYITKRDDQWSVALLAFHEAVKSYDFDKGAFLSFAETVIKRRLYDYSRKESRHGCEVLIDSYTLENDQEVEDASIKFEVMKKTADSQESDAKLEIQMISETLKEYGITFLELSDTSPKARKTKLVCGSAVRFLVQNPMLLNEMRRTKTLPLKIIEKNKNLPRKVLERHRKYIIAGAEIISGDYPILSEYLRFMREENPK
ncbi:MAG TPA: RNA polymerase sigma-I factor [Anaerovoracaceae bacterium]|nr:RNA polymerase sigma-I factor [Anaerovoracaceae bacterium]